MPPASALAAAAAEVGCAFSSWSWVAASVRAYGSISPSAVLSCVTSEESVFSMVAALTMAGNRAWSAARSVVGSCTAHWVSCALATACR